MTGSQEGNKILQHLPWHKQNTVVHNVNEEKGSRKSDRAIKNWLFKKNTYNHARYLQVSIIFSIDNKTLLIFIYITLFIY